MDINLHPDLKRVFDELGFSEWTDIQKKTIPLIQQNHDVIGHSYTGSGKTAAFGFPILEKTVHNRGIQSLILVPTRELAEQVTNEMHKFAKYKKTSIVQVYGGVSIGPQISRLRYADIVVATPGRMLDHIQRGTVELGNVNTVVLDEADKMFEMGFIDDVRQILANVPKNRQTLLFSATISHDVHEIVKNYMKNPHKIKGQEYVDKGKMLQYFYSVTSRDKFSLLAHLLRHEQSDLTIIFCATRKRVDVVGTNLNRNGINALSIHGGMTQNRRKQSIDMFHGNKANILVASDVAARGLDIKNVSHIINYDIPKTSKEYVHRIGRTARAGEEGKVISLLSEEDHDNFRNVLGNRSLVVEQLQLPQFQRVQFFVSHKGADRSFHKGHRRDFSRGGSSYGQRHEKRPYGERRDSSYHPRSHSERKGYGERSGSDYRSQDQNRGHSHSGRRERYHRRY